MCLHASPFSSHLRLRVCCSVFAFVQSMPPTRFFVSSCLCWFALHAVCLACAHLPCIHQERVVSGTEANPVPLPPPSSHAAIEGFDPAKMDSLTAQLESHLALSQLRRSTTDPANGVWVCECACVCVVGGGEISQPLTHACRPHFVCGLTL